MLGSEDKKLMINGQKISNTRRQNWKFKGYCQTALGNLYYPGIPKSSKDTIKDEN